MVAAGLAGGEAQYFQRQDGKDTGHGVENDAAHESEQQRQPQGGVVIGGRVGCGSRGRSGSRPFAGIGGYCAAGGIDQKILGVGGVA